MASGATVVLAGVLGAIDTDLRRGLAADATDQRYGFGHFGSGFEVFGFWLTAGVTGIVESIPRHRCASWSIIFISASRVAARSMTWVRSFYLLLELAVSNPFRISARSGL